MAGRDGSRLKYNKLFIKHNVKQKGKYKDQGQAGDAQNQANRYGKDNPENKVKVNKARSNTRNLD